MIGIGINENVVLIGATVGDKGLLVITFEEAEKLSKPKLDVFDALSSASVEEDSKGFSINIFPFKTPDGPKNETKTIDEKVEMVSDDMKKVKNQLTQILEQYLTTDNIKWEPYQGTGIDKDNYRTKFMDNDSLSSVFENYSKQFRAMVTPFLGNTAYKLRLKLARQSKLKHWATLPGRYIQDNPFVELMDIPKAQSKVAFTKWEKDNGFDDGTPVPKTTADVLPGEAAGAVATESVFGQR